MISPSTRKAESERRASIHSYLSQGWDKHRKQVYFVGVRVPSAQKWTRRQFNRQEDAQQFKIAYDAATAEQRTAMLETSAARTKEAYREALANGREKRCERDRQILSFIHARTTRKGDVRYHAYVRMKQGGRWGRYRSFATEQQAAAWVATCLSAIAKAEKLKRAEAEKKRFESDYAETVSRFNDAAFNNEPAIVAKRAPSHPPVSPGFWHVDLP